MNDGEYFVDTWYLIAELDARDRHNSSAQRLRTRLRGAPLITHQGVIGEFLAYFADEGAVARRRAVHAARDLLSRGSVLPIEDAFTGGLDLYAARPDKEYSLTDCVSMVMMRERGITHILTNDHHFQQEGFILLNQ